MGYKIRKIRAVSGRQSQHLRTKEIHIAESAQVEMRAFLPNVAHIQNRLAHYFFLESEAPYLLVRDGVADIANRADSGGSDVVQQPQRRTWRRSNATDYRTG